MAKKTLLVNAKTIKQLVTMKEAIKAVEKAFLYLGQGRVQMPAKIYLHLDEYRGDFRAMPAYVPGMGCMLKWVNVHPLNRKKGLPTVMALIIYNDPKTGFPLCVMEAGYLTALRTGAAGGVAVKYLARPDAHKVALIGCGVQARTQLAAIKAVRDIKQVIAWSPNHAECLHLKREIGKQLPVEIAATIKDCVKEAGIIVTTTPARKPLIKLSWIKPGTHINAIGADARGKQELEPKILKNARIVVDAWAQAAHSGEINVPLCKHQLSKKDIYADIGEIVSGKKKGRTNNKQITVFDSTGLAIQDVAVASLIYKKALRNRKGRYLYLICPA